MGTRDSRLVLGTVSLEWPPSSQAQRRGPWSGARAQFLRLARHVARLPVGAHTTSCLVVLTTREGFLGCGGGIRTRTELRSLPPDQPFCPPRSAAAWAQGPEVPLPEAWLSLELGRRDPRRVRPPSLGTPTVATGGLLAWGPCKKWRNLRTRAAVFAFSPSPLKPSPKSLRFPSPLKRAPAPCFAPQTRLVRQGEVTRGRSGTVLGFLGSFAPLHPSFLEFLCRPSAPPAR